MIIISQDKDEIINFDNVMNINIMDCKEEGYLISAGFIVGRDDNYRELGYYKTEERGKEVLQEIGKFYEVAKRFECSSNNGMAIFMSETFMYKMPED